MSYQDFQQNKGKKTRKRKAPHKVADLQPTPKRWKFKNPNRKVLIGRQEITWVELDQDQAIAEKLIEIGLGSLLYQE